MAALLTSVETPLGGESCAPPGADPGAEVLSCVLLTVRVPGLLPTAIREARKRLSGAAEAVKGLAAPRAGGRKRATLTPRYLPGTAPFSSMTSARRGDKLCLTIGLPLSPLDTARFTPHTRSRSQCFQRARLHCKWAPALPRPPHDQRLDDPVPRRPPRARSRETTRTLRTSPLRDQHACAGIRMAGRRRAREKTARGISSPSCSS